VLVIQWKSLLLAHSLGGVEVLKGLGFHTSPDSPGSEATALEAALGNDVMEFGVWGRKQINPFCDV
jgi:hypothetical protein